MERTSSIPAFTPLSLPLAVPRLSLVASPELSTIVHSSSSDLLPPVPPIDSSILSIPPAVLYQYPPDSVSRAIDSELSSVLINLQSTENKILKSEYRIKLYQIWKLHRITWKARMEQWNNRKNSDGGEKSSLQENEREVDQSSFQPLSRRNSLALPSPPRPSLSLRSSTSSPSPSHTPRVVSSGSSFDWSFQIDETPFRVNFDDPPPAR